jgi:hypothetical protein
VPDGVVPAPAVLSFAQPVTGTFYYSTTYAGPFFVWAIGYSDGVRQPYRCSPTYYGPASGTAVGAIPVFGSTGSLAIDKVQFLMRSADGLELLVDFVVSEQYLFAP